MESKLLLFIVSMLPHPSSLRDGQGAAGCPGLLAAHADEWEVLMHELTLLKGSMPPGRQEMT